MSKIAVKSPTGLLPKVTPNSTMPNWSSGMAPRLSKARSSPNVSKTTNPSTTKQTIKINDKVLPTATLNSQKRQTGICLTKNSGAFLKSPWMTISPKSGRNINGNSNVTIVQISAEPDNHNPLKETRSVPPRSRSKDGNKISKNSVTAASSNGNRLELIKKKQLKESGPSCTILEDRVLLKKGLKTALSTDSSRLPKKPEELRKKNLNRSTSLWNVQTTPVDAAKQTSRSIKSNSADSKLQKNRTSCNVKSSLNRATSLWSVPADSQCRLGKMPSRIPLSTQHLAGLGQSLGDLSLVDRSAEKPNPSVKQIIDLDEVDRSVDEHIYENCCEAIVVKSKKDSTEETPIYENLNKQLVPEIVTQRKEKVKKPDLSVSMSMPLTTSELEKRAEQLLSQLEEEEDHPVQPIKVQSSKKKIDLDVCKMNIEKSKDILSRSRDNLTRSREELARSKENLTRSQETLEKSRILAKSQDSLQILQSNKRSKCEVSIQEIRRNWERQIEKCQLDNEDIKTIKKRLSKSSCNVSGSRNDLNHLPPLIENNKSIKSATLQVPAKRTKDIVQLVNFFNCKNTESANQKPLPVIQDSWTKPAKDVVKSDSKVEKMEKLEKSCGYASDGNSSEDSGHISNENEPDWKDEQQEIKDFKALRKNEIFLEGIIQDLDASLERTIEVFDATPIVRHYVAVEPAKKAEVAASKNCAVSSSGASSIDSWDGTLKMARNTAKPAATPPTPSLRQRHNVPQIFFRAGALERLESERDEMLTGLIILLQARCRGFLARRKLNTLKLQDLAVRCIQRNVRKLMSVREWPWWRLYVKVAPLLNVHRTEDQLKARTEELEVLRAKVDRLEQERNHLKHDNDRLEAKVREQKFFYERSSPQPPILPSSIKSEL